MPAFVAFAAASMLVATEGEPLAAPPGARIAHSPSAVLAQVAAPFARAREGRILFRGEKAFLLSRDGDACELLLANTARAWVPCAALATRLFTLAELTAVPVNGGIAIATPDGERHTVRVVPLEFDRRQPVAAGIGYRERRWVPPGDGPFRMQILEVDPLHPAINVLPVHALDSAVGKETPGEMSARYGAQAAVNGGYFFVAGPYAGASQAMYQAGGQPIASGPERSSLALCEETNGVEQAEVNRHRFRGRVTLPSANTAIPLQGLNRPREAGELVLYRAPFSGRTRTAGDGFEVVLDAAGRVVRHEAANAQLPEAGGAVLSAGPGAADAIAWLRANAVVGAVLRVDVEFVGDSPAASSISCKAVDVIGAGPRLVRAGKPDVTEEGFAHQKVRHPRTAFAIRADGTWLFITLDGRQPASNGMTLEELAAELVRLGAREAINLDGGGSTVMITNGMVRNNPSDGRQRPVSDAILIFSTPDRPALENLLTTLARDTRQVPPTLHTQLAAKLAEGDFTAFATLIHNAGATLSPGAVRLLSEAAAAMASR